MPQTGILLWKMDLFYESFKPLLKGNIFLADID